MSKSKKQLTRREYRQLKSLIRDASDQMVDNSWQPAPSMRRATPHGDDNTDSALFPEILYVCQRGDINPIHVSTFLSLNTAIECTFVNVDRQQAVFFSQDNLNQFNKWYDEYLVKFIEGQKNRDYPPPADGHYPIMISRWENTTNNIISSNDHLQERWVWCLENLSSEVRYSGEYFFFCDPEDAALYTMMFNK